MKKKNSNYIRVEREFCECEFLDFCYVYTVIPFLIVKVMFFNVTKANKMNKKGNEKKSP